MPEGDTIHRSARTLHRALAGATVSRFVSRFPIDKSTLDGTAIVEVKAQGKHVLMRFDDGRTLRTHMRMSGSWHVYKPGERWQRPRRQAAIVLETSRDEGTAWVAVGFNVPEAELIDEARSKRLRSLGPDLLDASTDLDEVVARLRQVDTLPLGVALLRQSTVSGIGNVYKSEVCFIQRLNPFAAVADIDDSELRGAIELASDLLKKNLRGAHRITTRAGQIPLWVYGRKDEPCGVCEAPIEMRRQGDMGRSTYFCSECQRT